MIIDYQEVVTIGQRGCVCRSLISPNGNTWNNCSTTSNQTLGMGVVPRPYSDFSSFCVYLCACGSMKFYQVLIWVATSTELFHHHHHYQGLPSATSIVTPAPFCLLSLSLAPGNHSPVFHLKCHYKIVNHMELCSMWPFEIDFLSFSIMSLRAMRVVAVSSFLLLSSMDIPQFVYPFSHWRTFGLFPFLKKSLFIFRERGKEGERLGETSMCGCPSCTPHQGPGPQPRYVPWLGIEPATLWFTGQQSIH